MWKFKSNCLSTTGHGVTMLLVQKGGRAVREREIYSNFIHGCKNNQDIFYFHLCTYIITLFNKLKISLP